MKNLTEHPFLSALEDLYVAFDATGTAVEWNRAAADVTGYDADELAALTPPDLVGDADGERVLEVVAATRETGAAVVEADLVTAGGERVPYELKWHRLDDDGSAAYAVIGRDITDHHRQRETLENRERVLREMYEIVADRTRSFDDQVGALLALGRAELETAYGTLSRIDGEEYVFEVVDADDDTIQGGDVVPLAATNCEVAASEERTLVLGDVARDAPGETDRAGYAEWGISCYIGAPVSVDGEVYGTFCFYDTAPREGQFSPWEVTLVDLMSRWVSYELGRERANERLQAQNERLERFASIVSHDLRNPLNVVAGAVELAVETGELEPLTDARRGVERMETLIDDLLTLARSGDVIDDPEVVDLAALVEGCWETVVTDGASLAVETDRLVDADRTRLEQLVENLLRNAIEHGSDGVTVTVGPLDDGFYVADDGAGIPAGERERVLESGYSTSEDGTGFGLAIVAEIAEAHGWDLAVTEGAAGGARFEFTGVRGDRQAG